MILCHIIKLAKVVGYNGLPCHQALDYLWPNPLMRLESNGCCEVFILYIQLMFFRHETNYRYGKKTLTLHARGLQLQTSHCKSDGQTIVLYNLLNLPGASCCGVINTPRFGFPLRVLRAWPWKVSRLTKNKNKNSAMQQIPHKPLTRQVGNSFIYVNLYHCMCSMTKVTMQP